MTRLVVFSMVLEIFNNESVNSIFKYKLEYKFEYKLGCFSIITNDIYKKILSFCYKCNIQVFIEFVL